MPELPEVHTTVEGLKKVITGKIIEDVWSDFYVGARFRDRQNIKNKKYFDKFKKTIKGVKIKGLERRGKNILIHLGPSTSSGQVNYTIIVHMKMTGHLMVENYEKEKKYIHLVFSLSGDKRLVLSDMRKFASVTFSKTDELHLHDTVGKLGPDPLDPKFNAKKLFGIIHDKKGMPIKSALLDQATIAGIGNIYSDEILWQTSIHPLSRADQIPEKKFAEIFKVMQKILRLSIEHGGDSKSDYLNAFGKKGNFQNFHKAYGRKGQKCPKRNCSGIIERTVIGGRSAHFCPQHQIKYERH
jgi:formamidopyrimidine-DNA glycosylase